MRLFALVALLSAFPVLASEAFAEGANDELPTNAQKAVLSYQEAVTKAQETYREAVAKEKAKLAKALENECATQTKKGNVGAVGSLKEMLGKLSAGKEEQTVLVDTDLLGNPILRPHRFVSELNRLNGIDDASVPDELGIEIQGRTVSIRGVKKSDTMMLEGRLTGNFGKMFVCSLLDVECALEVKAPNVVDHCYYILITVDRAQQLTPHCMTLTPGVRYSLRIGRSGSEIAFALSDGKKDCLLASAPLDSLSAWAIAATVRSPGDRAELTATINPK